MHLAGHHPFAHVFGLQLLSAYCRINSCASSGASRPIAPTTHRPVPPGQCAPVTPSVAWRSSRRGRRKADAGCPLPTTSAAAMSDRTRRSCCGGVEAYPACGHSSASHVPARGRSSPGAIDVCGSGQLDGEGDAVEQPADVGDLPGLIAAVGWKSGRRRRMHARKRAVAL